MGHKLLYSCIFLGALCGCSAAPRPEFPLDSATVLPHGARSEALLQALLALDTEYRFGGARPEDGLDCSGLVAHVFHQAWGLRLPHNAKAQSERGVPVDVANLEPGDLVFYDTLNRPFSHVGIYLGEGRFVHAPKAGARVRTERLDKPYWRMRFNGARRLHPSL